MFGDLLDLDFSDVADAGNWDWLDELVNLGADVGDAGEWFVDSVTGEVVSAADADALEAADYDFGGLPEENVPGGPSGTSLSDQLRSRAVDPYTEGSEDFDPNAMADPTASIASAPSNGMDWAKMLKAGLGALGAASGALGGGMGGGAKAAGAEGLPSIPGLMGASVPQVGMPGGAEIARLGAMASPDMDSPRIGSAGGGMGLDTLGGADMPRLGAMGGGQSAPDMQGGLSALLSRLQADAARNGLQAPIDAGPTPRPFTPLVIPPGPGGVGMAQAPAPRMSGLQRLMLERLG